MSCTPRRCVCATYSHVKRRLKAHQYIAYCEPFAIDISKKTTKMAAQRLTREDVLSSLKNDGKMLEYVCLAGRHWYSSVVS